MTEDEAIETWCGSVQFAFTLLRGERLGELRGKRAKLFDERGLHPFSIVCGTIEAMQGIVPALRECGWDPVLARVEARKEADMMFRREIQEELLGQRNGHSGRSYPAHDGDAGAKALRDLAF